MRTSSATAVTKDVQGQFSQYVVERVDAHRTVPAILAAVRPDQLHDLVSQQIQQRIVVGRSERVFVDFVVEVDGELFDPFAAASSLLRIELYSNEALIIILSFPFGEGPFMGDGDELIGAMDRRHRSPCRCVLHDEQVVKII